MQNRRDELQNNYDDARLALFMDEYCEEKGAKLLMECDVLNNDSDAVVPEALHRRLQETVDRHFAVEERARRKPAVRRVLKRVLIAAAIGAVIFTTAFATVEEFRVGILNFSLKMQERYSTLDFEWNNDKGAQKVERPESIPKGTMQFGEGRIVVDFDLDEFEVLENIVDEIGVYAYLCAEGGNQTISIETSKIEEGMQFQIDTENADSISDVKIGDDMGYLIVKGTRNHIVWADSQNNIILEVVTTGLSEEYSMELAKHVTYIGEKKNK